MSAVAEKIKCEGCTRTYKWKPEFAGKNAKCKCGAKVAFPKVEPASVSPAGGGEMDLAPRPDLDTREKKSAAPAPAPPPDSGEMDLAPRPDLEVAKKKVEAAPATGSGACPNCKARVASGAVICTGCGTNLKTGKKLGTAVQGGAARPNAASAVGGLMSASLVFGLALVGAAVVAVAVGYFAVPEHAKDVYLCTGIGGVIVSSLAMSRALRTATDGNILLRIACRFVPFFALGLIIKQCMTDFQSVKEALIVGVLGLMATGVGFLAFLLLPGQGTLLGH